MNERKGPRRRETNEPAPSPVDRVRRRYWTLPLGGALAMAALLALTPISSAAGVASFSAPFTGGTLVQYRDAVSQGCGAHLAVTTPATFSLSTGVGTGAVGARSSPCSTSDSQSTYDGIVGVRGLSFSPAASASYTVSAHWTVTWNASASMSHAAAAAGGQATVEIWLLVKLHDATTGKNFAGKTLFLVKRDLATATKFAAGRSGATYTATLAAGLTAGDTYQLYAVLGFDVAAVIPQGSAVGAVATANVDLGSSGHGGTLSGVSVA